jgi:D-alanine-D-alanine ligase
LCCPRAPGIYARKGMGKKALEIDAAVLCFHGGLGEGGGAAALFNFLEIPATGSSVFAGAVEWTSSPLVA